MFLFKITNSSLCIWLKYSSIIVMKRTQSRWSCVDILRSTSRLPFNLRTRSASFHPGIELLRYANFISNLNLNHTWTLRAFPILLKIICFTVIKNCLYITSYLQIYNLQDKNMLSFETKWNPAGYAVIIEFIFK